MSKIILIGSDHDTINAVTALAVDRGYQFEHYTPKQWKEKTFDHSSDKNNVVSIRKDLLLPTGKGSSNFYLKSLDEVQSEAIRQALVVSKGNVSRVSKILNRGRATLYSKIKQYNIDLSHVRHQPPKKSIAA